MADPAPGSIADISLQIFNDLLHNLTHDIVLSAHRSEKLLRTQQQQQTALLTSQPPAAASADPSRTPAPQPPPGNPLATVPAEIICPRCGLPRHTPETLALPTTAKRWCAKPPLVSAPGCDIYGASYTGKKKGAAGGGGGGEGETPPDASAPRRDGIVYFRCSICESERVASTRYAQHLEKCLGLSGRRSGRAAMAKINGAASNGSNSPAPNPRDSPAVAPQTAPVPGEAAAAVEATPKKKKLGRPAKDPSGVSVAERKRKRKEELAALGIVEGPGTAKKVKTDGAVRKGRPPGTGTPKKKEKVGKGKAGGKDGGEGSVAGTGSPLVARKGLPGT